MTMNCSLQEQAVFKMIWTGKFKILILCISMLLFLCSCGKKNRAGENINSDNNGISSSASADDSDKQDTLGSSSAEGVGDTVFESYKGNQSKNDKTSQVTSEDVSVGIIDGSEATSRSNGSGSDTSQTAEWIGPF